MWGNWNQCILLVQMSNGAAAIENNMVIPQEIKAIITV